MVLTYFFWSTLCRQIDLRDPVPSLEPNQLMSLNTCQPLVAIDLTNVEWNRKEKDFKNLQIGFGKLRIPLKINLFFVHLMYIEPVCVDVCFFHSQSVCMPYTCDQAPAITCVYSINLFSVPCDNDDINSKYIFRLH